MNFFTMLSAVEAEKAKQKTAIGNTAAFQLPSVGELDAAASAEPEPAKKTKKKKEHLPEGNEAENVIQEDVNEESEE